MTNPLRLIALLLGLATAGLANHAHAQLYLGGGLQYNTLHTHAGLNVQAMYTIQEVWGIQLDAALYPPLDSAVVVEASANARYRIRLDKGGEYRLYPMVGVGLTGFQNEDGSINAGGPLSTGFSVMGGLGLDLQLTEKLVLFPEVRVYTGDHTRVVLGLGFRIRVALAGGAKAAKGLEAK